MTLNQKFKYLRLQRVRVTKSKNCKEQKLQSKKAKIAEQKDYESKGCRSKGRKQDLEDLGPEKQTIRKNYYSTY